LRENRVVWIWQREKMHFLVSVVARVRSHSQANLASATAKLL
jgi:hypothetical protein